MISGAYLAAWTSDLHEQMVDAQTSIARASALATSVMRGVGQPAVLQLPSSATHKWYTFEGSDADETHGVFFVLLAGSVNSASVTATVMLRWSITFDGPEMQVQGNIASIYPEHDWVPIFTDSVGDWLDGGFLTFKHSEGGAVVPWENAQPGVVYTTARSSTYITYKVSSGADIKLNYFSLMRGSALYNRALVPHLTLEDAKKYQETGANQYLVPYYAAGNWVKPDQPILKPVLETRLTSVSKVRSLEGRIEELETLIHRLTQRMGRVAIGPEVEESFEQVEANSETSASTRTLRSRTPRETDFQ
jgi:hypothetical protein